MKKLVKIKVFNVHKEVYLLKVECQVDNDELNNIYRKVHRTSSSHYEQALVVSAKKLCSFVQQQHLRNTSSGQEQRKTQTIKIREIPSS